jgi:hypothetical protein
MHSVCALGSAVFQQIPFCFSKHFCCISAGFLRDSLGIRGFCWIPADSFLFPHSISAAYPRDSKGTLWVSAGSAGFQQIPFCFSKHFCCTSAGFLRDSLGIRGFCWIPADSFLFLKTFLLHIRGILKGLFGISAGSAGFCWVHLFFCSMGTPMIFEVLK